MKPRSWWIQKLMNQKVLKRRLCPNCRANDIHAFYGKGEPFEYQCLSCFTRWNTQHDLERDRRAA